MVLLLPGVRNTDLARKGLRTGQQFQSQQEQPTVGLRGKWRTDHELFARDSFDAALCYLEAVITTGKRFVMTFDKEEEVWSQGERGKGRGPKRVKNNHWGEYSS